MLVFALLLVSVVFLISSFQKASAQQAISTAPVTIIGDSLTVGAQPYLQKMFPAAVIIDKGSQPWSWGMDQLNVLKAQGKLYPTLVFAFGTNPPVGASDVDALLAAAPGSKIILVTIYNGKSPAYADQANNIFRLKAAANPSRIVIADWHAAVSAHPDWVGGDGVHATGTHYQDRANLIALAIAGAGSGGAGGTAGAPVSGQSNCVITQIGSPQGQPVLPPHCIAAGGGGGVGIGPGGFVFPLKTTKTAITTHNPAWCSTCLNNQHGVYNAADIFAATGTIVVAPRPGTVIKLAYAGGSGRERRGHRVTLKGDPGDGRIYFHNHMLENSPQEFGITAVGQHVTAGQPIGKVGTNADAEGTPSHLHFDVLPATYTFHPSCPCLNSQGYINIQPELIDAFNKLPQ